MNYNKVALQLKITFGQKITVLMCCMLLFACQKADLPDPSPPAPPTPAPDQTTPLKNEAEFPIGVAITYGPMVNDAKYQEIVKRDFDAVTFDYSHKHGAIVSNNGIKNYAAADELVQRAAAAGLSVFGHTLVWHQNNNGDYLRSLSVAVVASGPDVLTTPADLNGKFDNGGSGTTPATLFQWWYGSVSGGSNATFEREPAANAQQGAYALKARIIQPGANPWDVQFLHQDWKPTAGKTYQIKFWARSENGGSFRAINQTPNAGSPHFSTITVTPPGTWTEVVWNYTAPSNAIQFGFHFPSAGTFWIDNVSITETTTGQINQADAAKKVDSVLKDWIITTVNRYKSTVRAWDVVNEPFTDGSPVLRNGSNTTGDTYYWAQYLGRNYIVKAFQYAREADATADLYLNDYNLEINSAKLDSIVALAGQLKSANVPINGIGTQMHVRTTDSYNSIDQMMLKLASTGLKIRVSELDVRVGNGGSAGTPPTAAQLATQAAMYKHVVSSYKKNIPRSQQAGITVWGVTDNTSWLYNNGADYPLLYDVNYNRKPAYAAFLTALRAP